MKSFNTNNIILLPTIMSSDPSLNPDHPLHGFEYIVSDKKGDMYKKNDEFYYLTVACVDGKKEGKAEMKSMDKDKPVCILTYQNDKLNGECIRIDDKGCQLKCTLKDDILNGPFSSYDENDTLICQGEYKNGNEVFREFPSSSKKAAGIAAGIGAGVATGAITHALGGVAALLGFSSPGIISGSVAASAMSVTSTTGLGAGLVSAAQSAGALFVNAFGGSTIVAAASAAAPVVVAGAVGYGLYRWLKSEK